MARRRVKKLFISETPESFLGGDLRLKLNLFRISIAKEKIYGKV